MDFSDQVILVYLEEDNIQRAFFRIRPLLRRQGPLTAQQIAEYPDDGFLRIVPDKNEQHTFKERMRGLGNLCVLNLKNIPPEANKIRTNKNYSPTRGETNQFIVYSDAVQPIPQKDFFEVVAQGNAQNAVTPFVYTRVGGNIHGPVDRATGADEPGAQQLPPDSPGLFAVTLPSGVEKLFYWPTLPGQKQETPTPIEQPARVEPLKPVEKPIEAVKPVVIAAPVAPKPVEAPVPVAPAQPAPLPSMTALEQIQKLDEKMNASTNRLDAPAATFAPPAEETRKLTGTPLYQAPVRKPFVPRSHNPLMETVERERFSARYEAPGAQLTNAAEPKDILNPVEQFKRALSVVWRAPETQRQTVEAMLAMPGIREMVAKGISAGGNDLTLAAMHTQLQDLEAERLMTLMQLEDIKKSAQAAREEAAKELTAAQRTQLDQLKAETARAKAALDQLNAEREQLLDDRDKVLDAMEEMADAEDILRLAPGKGEAVDVKEMIARVAACLKAQGFEATQEDAVALLLNYALCDGQMGLSAPTTSDALDAARAFSHALGAASGLNDYAPVHVYAGGDAPAFVLSVCASIEENEPYTRIVLGEQIDETAQEYALRPWGYTYLNQGITPPCMMPSCPPVQAAQLKGDLLDMTQELPQEAKRLLTALRAALANAGYPLSICLYAQLSRFVAAAQKLMNGGIAAALDEGVLTYVVPYLRYAGADTSLLRELCAAMPRTLKNIK